MEVLLDTCGRRDVKSLLLLTLYFFFLKAAADCPKPEGRENIILTNEALLMNSFPEGSNVTLECAKGYVRENGSGNMNCKDGHWSKSDLTCKKKDCGQPETLPHMSYDTRAGTLFGASIKVICEKGYQISGANYKQCFAGGWKGRSKCEIVTCDKPGEVTNGKIQRNSQDYPKYGETIKYLCNVGYTLTGNDSIMCTETGEYNSQPPECKENVFIGVATEDRITTNMGTQTPTPPTQEASTTTESSATETAHRDTTITASGRDISTAEDKSTTTSITSATPSSFQEHDEAVDANKDIGYTPVIISVTCVSLVAIIAVVFIQKFFLRRKGSYDTGEDLKPELQRVTVPKSLA